MTKVSTAMTDAKNAAEQAQLPSRKLVLVSDNVLPIAQGVTAVTGALDPVVKKLEVFASLVEGIGGVRALLNSPSDY
jgi:hypothetical protein